MTKADHPLSVQWLLFGFRGRIGRKSFLLAALFLVLVQLAMLSFAGDIFADTDGDVPAGAALYGLALLASWALTAFSLLALAVKSLHDLSLPSILGIVLLIPGISIFAWLFLAAAPSKQETNKHGPVPFARK